MKRVITLTTDFGLSDPYVGIMKGVILKIGPDISIVDLTHGVEPGRCVQSAFLLSTAVDFFPGGTVHLVVVDPGVGTSRRALAVSDKDRFFVGPDNGCLGSFAAGEEVVEITETGYLLPGRSATFHGRDVFAPAAAHLATGLPLSKLGPRAEGTVILDLPKPLVRGEVLEAPVVHVDRFGNLVTCLGVEELFAFAGSCALVFTAGPLKTDTFVATYHDAPKGALIAYEGSSGHLEIGVTGGSAASHTGAGVGDTVAVTRV